MNKFRTQYDDHQHFFSNSGDPEYQVYSLDENGDPILVSTNNRFDEIQSHRESVELSTLLQRYAAGDESALNKHVPISGDFADAPSNLQEWFERYKQATADFNGLPAGLKELFNNNPAEFWTTFGSEEFTATLKTYRESVSGEKSNNGSSNTVEPNNVTD